jgi:hypothetical protein
MQGGRGSRFCRERRDGVPRYLLPRRCSALWLQMAVRECSGCVPPNAEQQRGVRGTCLEELLIFWGGGRTSGGADNCW